MVTLRGSAAGLQGSGDAGGLVGQVVGIGHAAAAQGRAVAAPPGTGFHRHDVTSTKGRHDAEHHAPTTRAHR